MSLLYIFCYACVAVFFTCVVMRFLKLARLPVHVRWELYPVAHEPGAKAKYGGSILEEPEWWTKPRKTSKLKEACKEALAPSGSYVSVDDGTPDLPAADLDLLKRLAEAGELRPVIDRRFPLEKIVEAHAYVEGEHKRGNVVVTISHDDCAVDCSCVHVKSIGNVERHFISRYFNGCDSGLHRILFRLRGSTVCTSHCGSGYRVDCCF